MNNYQFNRYQKIFINEFYLLDWKDIEEEINFSITGSTYNIYKLIISKKDKNIQCSCIDFTENCFDKNIICKHCCFILFSVLKLFHKIKPNINKIELRRPRGYNVIKDSQYFDNLVFSNLELLLIDKKIKQISLKKNCHI